MEVKQIEGCEDYYVRDDGKVVSFKKQNPRVLNGSINSSGYFSVSLYRNKTLYSQLVHRLVAEAFLPNPENKRTVNHIDGNKRNNVVANLEWMTYSENHLHSYQELGRVGACAGKFGKDNHSSKPVDQMTIGGEIIRRWYSMADAERSGFHHSAISKCCSGTRKTHGGFCWKFI